MAVTEKAQAVYERLFGQKPQTHETDPELYEILQNFIFDEVFATGVLNDRTREQITIAVLAAMQTLPQLKAHAGAALRIGVTPLEIRETVYQCAPFIGFPKTLNAVSAINEVFTEHHISLPLPGAGTVQAAERFDAGSAVQLPLYGSEIREACGALPGSFAQAVPTFLTELCFGDFYTRSALDVKTRELLILCVLASLGVEQQLQAHVAGACRAGNSKLELTAALVQALPYIGFPYALNALRYVMPQN